MVKDTERLWMLKFWVVKECGEMQMVGVLVVKGEDNMEKQYKNMHMWDFFPWSDIYKSFTECF